MFAAFADHRPRRRARDVPRHRAAAPRRPLSRATVPDRPALVQVQLALPAVRLELCRSATRSIAPGDPSPSDRRRPARGARSSGSEGGERMAAGCATLGARGGACDSAPSEERDPVAKVTMPQLGESVAEGTIGRWLKQPGDSVAKYEPLLEVITDKVNAEVPSPFAGVLKEILAAGGRHRPQQRRDRRHRDRGRGAVRRHRGPRPHPRRTPDRPSRLRRAVRRGLGRAPRGRAGRRRRRAPPRPRAARRRRPPSRRRRPPRRADRRRTIPTPA